MPIHDYGDRKPRVADTAFIAEGAHIIGGVEIGDRASILFNCVLRGDINDIKIGACSNIQDNSTLHVADEWPCIVGEYVTVGHGVNLHGCVIEDQVMVGMGAIVMKGASASSTSQPALKAGDGLPSSAMGAV